MFLPFVDEPEVAPPSMSTTAPSGLFGLEMELACAEPAVLSDAELVDAMVGFERMAAWAAARQHAVVAGGWTGRCGPPGSCCRPGRSTTHGPG